MSVAALSSTETKGQTSQPSLWTTGLVGGVYVLAALAVVFFAVPTLWDTGVSSWLVPIITKWPNIALRLIAQAGIAIMLAFFGISLAGPNPPRGIRGSIFLG